MELKRVTQSTATTTNAMQMIDVRNENPLDL